MKKTTTQSVRNPLTMIGIFSGVSEVAMLYTIAKLPLDLQSVFIWFVMLFPLVLVISFFFILYKNPAVLFSPSDYNEDATYLDSIGNKNPSINKLEIEQLKESVTVLQDFMEQLIIPGKPKEELEAIFVEKRKQLDSLHNMQQNNLFSFLKNELGLSTSEVVNTISESKKIQDLPLKIMELTSDEWKMERTQNILNRFPKATGDFEELIRLIKGGEQ